jgi:hypothetical protein
MADNTENAPVIKDYYLYRERTKKGAKEKITSGRSNHALKARKFGQELTDMPQTTFRVWYAMRNFEVERNYVNARFRQIAQFMGVSIGAVQDAMRYMEEHNLIVRVSDPGKKASWMINPELQWNWERKLYRQGLAIYRSEKAKNRKENNQDKENNDIITEQPNDVLLDKEPGDAPCASKLKAA